jgi:hypothetical protein
MILGRMLVPRLGAGSLIGVSAAVLGIPLGLNHPFAYTLGLYGGCGLALDLVARIPGFDQRRLVCAVIAGSVAHLVKFSFIILSAVLSPVTRHFLLWGVVKSAVLHLVFGVLAGLLAWMVAGVIGKIGAGVFERRSKS